MNYLAFPLRPPICNDCPYSLGANYTVLSWDGDINELAERRRANGFREAILTADEAQKLMPNVGNWHEAIERNLEQPKKRNPDAHLLNDILRGERTDHRRQASTDSPPPSARYAGGEPGCSDRTAPARERGEGGE